MAFVWVDGDAILIHSGAYQDPAAATPADQAWADIAADAISAGIDSRLSGSLVDGTEPEILAAALNAGVELYRRREATFGLTGYMDLQGAAIRLARDYLESIAPILARYATVGIA